ncbi:hypothetical protein BC833DRAFT_565688 [Globomyces pollinis-pini]|nr:hypothetical protein BC833DRAFT_565688 [Globomyces pollinis-pini]
MAKGAFMSVNRSKGDHETSTDNCQVVFGGENGILYVLDNYKILEYATVGYSITEVLGISHSQGKSDYVLCRGHFPGVYLYHEGKLIIHFETNDWVYAISLSDDRTLALGVMDDTIQLIKLEESIDR